MAGRLGGLLRTTWKVLLLLLVALFAGAAARAEKKENSESSCEARGGVAVRLSVAVEVLGSAPFVLDNNNNDNDNNNNNNNDKNNNNNNNDDNNNNNRGGAQEFRRSGDPLTVCVARGCPASAFRGEGCEVVRDQLVANLLSTGQQEQEEEEEEPSLPPTKILVKELWPWISTSPPGTGPHAVDRAVYQALRSKARAPRGEPSAGPLRWAVLGTHGPLSALMGEHLLTAQRLDGGRDLELVFYGQCYLCNELESCRTRHVASQADDGCNWFHGAPDQELGGLESEIRSAASAIAAREPHLSGVTCLGLLFCHFLFEALPASVLRLQFLCMNPLQGSHPALAERLLRSMAARAQTERTVFTTNAVTSALLAYHLGLPEAASPAPAMGLLPMALHKIAQAVAFDSSLRAVWPGEVNDQPTTWDMEDTEHVAWLLQHRAVVYLPEHFYKNVFNDFYAAGMPIFLPSLPLLGWLWPRLRQTERDATYDGWLDRRIPRVRLNNKNDNNNNNGNNNNNNKNNKNNNNINNNNNNHNHNHVVVANNDALRGGEVPEPFDLDVDGETKVRHWLRLADFYHAPGVQTFGSIASLLEGLKSTNLEAVREEMERHFQAQTAASISIFRSMLRRSSGSSGRSLEEAAAQLHNESNDDSNNDNSNNDNSNNSSSDNINSNSNDNNNNNNNNSDNNNNNSDNSNSSSDNSNSNDNGNSDKLNNSSNSHNNSDNGNGNGNGNHKTSLEEGRSKREAGRNGKDRRPAFSACLAAGSGVGVGVGDGAQLLRAWTLRFGPGVLPPPRLRLQVWRPVRVGWEKGDRALTFQLVGEHRTRPAKPAAVGRRSAVWRVAVPRNRRLALRAGDRLAWAVDSPVLRSARWRRRRLQRQCAEAPSLCLGFRELSAPACGSWPLRKVCRFQALQHLPLDVSLEAEIAPIEPEDEKEQLSVVSVAFEMDWRVGAFAMWFLEWSHQLLSWTPSASTWTFLICPPMESDGSREEVKAKLDSWRKVFEIFDSTVGLSLGCREAELSAGVLSVEDVVEASKEFLMSVSPYAPWVILAAGRGPVAEAAKRVADASPVGLGLVLREANIDAESSAMKSRGFCARDFDDRMAPISMEACTIAFGEQQVKAEYWPSTALSELIRREDVAGMKPVWGPFVAACGQSCIDDILTQPEPHGALAKHLTQAIEFLKLGSTARSFGQVARLARLRPALNVRSQIDSTTSYEEFMTLRQQLSSPDLGIFEDKIRLRRDLLQKIGVAHTPTIYMSNSDPSILEHITGRSDFVVKPTHMTESEYVAVVRDGRHLFDVHVDGVTQRMAGEPVDHQLLQQRMLAAWNKTAYDWECQAVVSARPGVIVEELVLAYMDPTTPEVGRVEEARAHVIWGKVMAVEWAVHRAGSIVFYLTTDYLGIHHFSSESIWAIGNYLERANVQFGDGESWADAVKEHCLRPVIQLAERVASGAHADHLRVDLLVEGRCDHLYVSEVELFPAVPFSPNTMETIERRWRNGYLLR